MGIFWWFHWASNSCKQVTGTVTVKLYKGNVYVVAAESPFSLFDANLATFEKNPQFNQNCSAGFIEIYNLPQLTAHKVFSYESPADC